MQLDFIVAGFSKCGTTTLCSLLDEHPDIFIPEMKETAFFAWAFHRKGWDWYRSLFEPGRGVRLHGEGTTFYTAAQWERMSCDRIVRYVPGVKLILIARHPILRLESAYRENHHSGHLLNVRAPYGIGPFLRAFPNTVADTLFWQRINTYRSHFPDERFHVMFLEDLRRDPQRELARCFEFLGVDPSFRVRDVARRENSGEEKLYDSWLMRFIRSHRRLNRYWGRMEPQQQDRWGRRLGLRRPFRGPVRWRREDYQWVIDQIADDARQFLAFYGKPADFWDLEWSSRAAAA